MKSRLSLVCRGLGFTIETLFLRGTGESLKFCSQGTTQSKDSWRMGRDINEKRQQVRARKKRLACA